MRTLRTAVAVAVLVLAGCSGTRDQAADEPSGSPTPSASSSATSPASLWPTPVAYGPATLVTGSDAFSVDMGTATTDADGTIHDRGAFRSTLTCDDERVAGRMVAQWNTSRWDGALIQWGRARITNDGGRWVGRYTGVFTAKTFDMITWWFTGTGGYEGLSMYMWEETSGGPEGTFHALVFPGGVPPR